VRQVHRPAVPDAVFDLETLPMKINVRLVPTLELQAPADAIVNFAVGNDLVDRAPRVAPLELDNCGVQYRAFALGGERVGEAQAVRTRPGQRETAAGEGECCSDHTKPKPAAGFQ